MRLFDLCISVYVPDDAQLPVTFNDWIERAFAIPQSLLIATPTTLQSVSERRYPLAKDVIARQQANDGFSVRYR